MKKKWITMGMTLILACSLPPAGAMAKFKEETARIRPDFTIVIDGTERNFKRADGSAAYALVYQDSTYLPLRAIGEALGRNVNWNEATKTITLEGRRTASDSSNKYIAGKAKDVTVQVRTDFTIVIDGIAQQFRTSSGKAVYPLLYNGSTYLPLRAIGEIMDKDVKWNNSTKTVTLTSEDGYTVTDADSFGGSNTVTDADNVGNTTQPVQPADIGMWQAKKIALQDAGLNESNVDFMETETDYDDGRKIYEIEFGYDYREYDYEIDAQTGHILEFDNDCEYDYYDDDRYDRYDDDDDDDDRYDRYDDDDDDDDRYDD